MRKLFFQSAAILTILILGLAFSNSQAKVKEKSELGKVTVKNKTAPLPRSLDTFYPPRAKEPIYLFKMMELAISFTGIVVDLFEEDHQNAKANFEKFKSQYLESSKMVPEWKKYYPEGPIKELGVALQTGDQGKIMASYEKMGNVCHECHVATMVNVQQKYHWRDFRMIKVMDPLTDEVVDYRRFMQGLVVNFMGIIVDVQEGQIENAQKQFQGFKARFQAMEESCEECHGTEERKYFVDESVHELIDKLGQSLGESSIDPKAVETSFQAIGMESCFKCHLIHVPAAYAKY
ncbi:MAG: hypothetical protein GTO16_13745 [Candidatus Aminicenantes bacterium]|nr:hypothetical protein [Candidatus Aminicenantes bacterium]